MKRRKGDYGVDAPKVVKNLFLCSFCLLLLSTFSFQIQIPLYFWIVFLYASSSSIVFLVTGCWMLYCTKVVKPKMVTKLIQNLNLRGHEKVLDLGCGRGLMLCEVAQHLPRGEAHGIDVWSTDQSGNKPEATLENARLEGIQERVTVHTGDVQTLPFPDAAFDAIVSSLCIHNIKNKNSREKVLSELLRILKSGGKFAIADIHHAKEYAAFLKAAGAIVICSKPNYSYLPPIITIEGSK